VLILLFLTLTENTEIKKGPEKVDDFLFSLFKSLERQKSKDDRKTVDKKVIVFLVLNITDILYSLVKNVLKTVQTTHKYDLL